MRMRRWLVFCLVMAATLPAYGGEDPLGPVFDGIRERYGSLSGLTMPYSREVITRSMSLLGTGAKGDSAAGRIYFRAPHFLRMEQTSPRVELLVTDGNTIWWYVPDEHVVHRYAAERFGQELRLLNDIFQGLLSVEERFAASYAGRSEDGQDKIVLRPDPPWEEIDHVVIYVSPSREIRRVEIHNVLGTTTIFTLGGPEPKTEFPPGFFRFVPPEGVQVVEEAAQ